MQRIELFEQRRNQSENAKKPMSRASGVTGATGIIIFNKSRQNGNASVDTGAQNNRVANEPLVRIKERPPPAIESNQSCEVR